MEPGSDAFHTRSWARGRIDALLQILALLDKDRADQARTEWNRVLGA
ncbi:hypothetical protein [Demequina litorisediminis]|nr:hypothetical protein [Demequina litorisediminis]